MCKNVQKIKNKTQCHGSTISNAAAISGSLHVCEGCFFFPPGGGHTVPDIPSSAHLTAAGAQGSETCCEFDCQ